MRKSFCLAALALSCSALIAETMTLDVSAVRPGPVTVEATANSATVRWKDAASRNWAAEFSLDTAKPLITSVAVEGKRIIERAQPFYRVETGKRRGGFDAFFDFPPSHPEGTRAFLGEFHPKSARARSMGDRIEISFDGMRAGIFQGSIRYLFYPGSHLIEQQAAMTTQEPDTAYFYDAGIRMAEPADERSGGNMESHVAYFDTNGQFQTIVPAYGSERRSLAVRYRALAAKSGVGSVAVFPAPHQYMMARDYTTNMGYVWYTAWRGNVSLGIRQYPDDYSPYYPWMNAPPGTEQQMRMFISVDDRPQRDVLDGVLRYTHGDRFPVLAGYKTFAPHWHLAYTMQAREKGFDWQPPFKAAMKAIGIDAAMIMDFHGDGHPRDMTEVRLQELGDFFQACRAQSGKDFLLMPAEEANIILGGHWGLVFPRPVYWYMDRKPGQPFRSADPKYGTVYRVSNPKEVWDMVQAEKGYVYQTHPRTKGSTGYPDLIKDTEYFRDPRYLGSGWKAMPADLSSPRLAERAFKTVDDMNNLGLRKRMIGEVDVFQLDTTHELYGHMNVNYVRLPSLPSYDNYGQLLDAVAKGDYFVTTGEIILSNTNIKSAGDKISAHVSVSYTFPLRMAEVVWGDGLQTFHKIFPLDKTREFQEASFDWEVDAKNWKWARLAVWDVAGNGAFINPVWR
ncbi:MAG: hypothetical protein M3Z36_08730 [Acidobacteriota bacterium]|nr:hypothetical protein [Acidobacteriota bacterium]